MSFVYYAHSGIRYLVLLVGVAAVAYHTLGLLGRRPFDRVAKVLGTAFVGVVDLQVLLGLLLWWLVPFYAQLTGHIVLMLAAAIVAHVASVASRRRGGSHAVLVIGEVVALALILGGVWALGRGLLQSSPLA